ncbi:gamma-glutamyltransferase [Pseudidiomarina salinarum]|uniref:Glutathione hydrolase proenzyme n=1 Tax=Pseudidiomarina salinarum TaxID=435908 RepID=A0A094IW80_9GAMM|nr:gamma-glutamyltransferase [Pseudidiomarina salinarum]KFZ31945.1 gamma-glutamyltransferase [Pseudidiomarina salinarum]RUO70278.1 gamma-glutamyltransferase [Pseudidiomarina salinarum]
MRLSGLLLIGSIFLISACGAEAPPEQTQQPEAATGFIAKTGKLAEDYLVVAATPPAAKAGEAVLAAGGNAIDAAIAVQAMLTLTEPQSSGIGGGAFILYWDDAAQRLYTIDAREQAPQAAGPDLFLDAQGRPPESFWDAVIGGRSVGTPGVLRGLELAHQRWGKLPWSDLFTPSITAAREGFVVSPRLQRLLELEINPGLPELEPARSYFYPQGQALQAGQTKRNPALADTFQEIAKGGADAFYTGAIAADIVTAVQHSGGAPGLLSKADLAGYQAVIRQPVCSAYRVYQICGMGPPSSGGISVLQILGILENFPVSEWDPTGADALHYFTQASRLAFADRNRYIADSDYVAVPVAQMLDEGYLAQRASLITNRDMGKAMAGELRLTEQADDQSPEFPNTSHLSIIDAEGNAIAMTTSIEMGFGSAVMARGFLLNNQLTDFSLVPEVNGMPVANRVEPGKRPRSSMAPTMVFDEQGEQLIHVVGSPGGQNIILYVAQALLGLLDWNMNMQEAVNQPHVTNTNRMTVLEAETTLVPVADELKARGHEVRIGELNSGLHGITVLPDGRLFGAADPRREGLATGN